jgi:hypothetical protein
MTSPLMQIVFHQLTLWPGAEVLLRERAVHLLHLCPDIQSLRLVVEETQRHHRLGRPVTVRIEVQVAGHDLTVSRRHDTDFHIATRTAFEAMERRLQDLARRRRGDVKTHADQIHGGPALHADDLSAPSPDWLAAIDAQLDDEPAQDAMVALAAGSPPSSRTAGQRP